MATPDLRCPECRFYGNQIKWVQNSYRCPNCNSGVTPFDPDHDVIIVGHSNSTDGGVYIRVGWAELRILSIWSRFWADAKAQENPEQNSWMLRVVDAVVFNLKKAGAGRALTIGDDLERLRKENPDAKAVRPNGTEILLEPGWLNRPAIKDPPSKES